MKTLRIFTTALLLLSIGFSTMSFKGREFEKAGTHFQDWSWGETKDQARIQNKGMMVFIGTSYCHESEHMANYTFKYSKLAGLLNKSFVAVKLDTKNTFNNMRASNLGVSTIPCVIFYSETGKEISRVQGYKDPEVMVSEAQNAVDKIQSDREALAIKKSAKNPKVKHNDLSSNTNGESSKS